MSENLTIASRAGLALEAAVDVPDDARGFVTFCHPHPRFGGTMNAPLMVALRDDLLARNFGILRFNFRGVGSSEGESGLGVEEVADAAGALDVARERFPKGPHALLGWSFGGAVAIRTAAREEVDACVAIAPAVEHKDSISAGLPSPEEMPLTIPLLVVIGANDEQISPESCRAWTGSVETAEFVQMPGANHFFWAKYPDLAGTVGSWLEARFAS